MTTTNRLRMAITTAALIACAPPGRAATPAYTLLHTFNAPGDGTGFISSLTPWHGLLFGTQFEGGSTNHGVVFSISHDGTENVVHSFGTGNNGFDGTQSDRELVAFNGLLYGTTNSGGQEGHGTIFTVSTTGQETVVYSFSGDDGSEPCGLTVFNHALYGTTGGGGANNAGIIFRLSHAGVLRTLYSFTTTRAVGYDPQTTLVNVDGVLYGATFLGGLNNRGTVFSLSHAGQPKVHFALGGFAGRTLLAVGNTLYGTESSASENGKVFSYTQTAGEATLYDFSGSSLAGLSGLTWDGNKFYGVTIAGGAYQYGTLFALMPTGKLTILHEFGSGADGGDPTVSPIVVGHSLYGTTPAFNSNLGTVYRYKH